MQVIIRTAILGLVTGSIYSLASVGLVLTYKTSGILNFGFGALAMFTTFIHWQFTIKYGMPVWLSALLVVFIIAPLIGVFLDTQLFRRIEGQPVVIGVIVTVGLFVLFQGLVGYIWGGTSIGVPSLFPRTPINIPGGGTIGLDGLLVLVVGVTSALALGAVLRFTRLGVSFRAVVDNRPVAGLMAINTGFVSAGAWALGCSFAALTGILLAPRLQVIDPSLFPAVVVSFVFGAAIFGYLKSLPLAFVGGLVIGLIQAFLIQYATGTGFLGDIGNALPFVLVSIFVLLAPRKLRQSGLGASFVVRARELSGQAPQAARTALVVVFFGALAVVPFLVKSVSWKLAITTGLLQSIVFISIVILTGYSGQISLSHTAFMGIASFTTAHIAATHAMPVWASLALGSLAAVPAGALIGFIAVRLHGLFLALMTLAFAFMAQQMFFQKVAVSGPEGILPLPRPEGFTSDRGYYYLALLALAAAAFLATNLRSGRAGRILASIRDSETATRSLGINVVKYKVIIFSLSAFLAALGGTLGSMQTGQVTRLQFIPFLSIFLVAIVVVGGIFHIGGAIAAGMFFGLYSKIFGPVNFMLKIQLILFGLGASLAIANNPEGMFGEMRRGAHAVLGLFSRTRPARREPVPVAGGQE